MMTDKDLIQRLRLALQPFPVGNKVVRLQLDTDSHWFNPAFVKSCIDCLEKKALWAEALGEEMNDLERLGAMVLMDSAVIVTSETNHHIETKESATPTT